MKIDELIEKHEQAVAEEVAEKANKLQALIADKQVIFQNHAKLRAGDLWSQLMPEGTLWLLTDRKDEIRYEIPVSWGGRVGAIKQNYDIRSEKWSDLHLTFGYLSDGYKTHTLELNLPSTDRAIGAFFSLLKKCLDFKEEKDKALKARDLKILLDFSHLNEFGVANRLKDAISIFPEHKDDFNKKAEEQLALIKAESDKRLIDQLSHDLRQSEEAQLELLVDFAWKRPFQVYKVTYGAKIDGTEDGERAVYTDYFYTLMTEDQADMPHNRGYWTAFESGKYTRLIKPRNIISTEIVNFNSHGTSPIEVRRFATIHSKVISDVSIVTTIPAVELFAFDYDELRVAMETEQESEIADASQEDNS